MWLYFSFHYRYVTSLHLHFTTLLVEQSLHKNEFSSRHIHKPLRMALSSAKANEYILPWNMRHGEKWEVKSSLVLLEICQIGSNFCSSYIPPMCLFLFFSPPLICDYEASSHYPPEVWSTTSVFQRIWWERQKGVTVSSVSRPLRKWVL